MYDYDLLIIMRIAEVLMDEESPEKVREWGFGLTTVDWRKNHLAEKIEKTQKIVRGEEKVKLAKTGEDGVNQIRALLGLHTFVANVNIPNVGQISNLPLDVVVETNAVFSSDHVTPCMAGPLPLNIYGMISRVVSEQETVVAAGLERDLEKAFTAFSNNGLVTINTKDARVLFDKMVENTKAYLTEYFK